VTLYSGKPLLNLNSNGTWRNYYASTNINDGKWHRVYIFVDRDNTTGGAMYVDGKLILTFNPTVFNNRSLSTNEPLWIERHLSNKNNNFAGYLDELRIWKVTG
jgi:hypothetical protein